MTIKGKITKKELHESVIKLIETSAGSNSSGGGSTKLVHKKSSTTINTSTNTVAINIPEFNKNTDILMVYKNSTYIEENEDYTISEDSMSIINPNGNWNESEVEMVFNFVVLKSVPKIQSGDVISSIIKITSSEWIYSSEEELYYKDITHNLGTEYINVTAMSTDTKDSVELAVNYIDNNNIKVYSAINENIIVYLQSANTSADLVVNQIDDSVIDDNKTWSSEKIKNSLQYMNVKDFGAKGDYSQNDAIYIQMCLDMGGTIYIPEGEYRIDKQLVIKSNTNIIMHKNAKLYNNIHQTQPKGLKGISIFANYNIDDDVNGYNLASNINIRGGQLIIVKNEKEKEFLKTLGDIGSQGISISHGSDIIIKNVIIKDTFRAHGIEITGCKNIIVDNCILDGCILTELDKVRVREAIQIEHSGTSGGLTGTSPSMQDNTVSKNITIKNCLITRTNNNSDYWGSGIGSHNNDNIEVMNNIVIENNIIENCSHAGIMYINYKNSRITGNNIKGCARGIGIYQSRPSANLIIENNNIEDCCKSGIVLVDNSYNISIINNRFFNIQESAITGQDLIYLKILNNQFTNCCENGITNGYVLTYGLKDSIISNNLLSKTTDTPVKYGLYLGSTVNFENVNSIQNNNRINFPTTQSDIHCPLFNTTDKLLDDEFHIYNNQSIKLNKSVYGYNAINITLNGGVKIETTVPVTIGGTKVNFTDISNSTNSITFIEFTLSFDDTGRTMTVYGSRYMTIINGVQTVQDITSGLQIKITSIRGI